MAAWVVFVWLGGRIGTRYCGMVNNYKSFNDDSSQGSPASGVYTAVATPMEAQQAHQSFQRAVLH